MFSACMTPLRDLQIVPLIDGTNHVKKIAVKANADIELVKECMSHLL